jgi:hypothetical protein
MNVRLNGIEQQGNKGNEEKFFCETLRSRPIWCVAHDAQQGDEHATLGANMLQSRLKWE